MAEKALYKALQSLLGDEVWLSLSKKRKLCLLELVEQYSFVLMSSSYGTATFPPTQIIEDFAKKKLREIEGQELIAVLKNDTKLLPELNINNFQITKPILTKLNKRMLDILEKVKALKLDHPFLKKRQSDIVDALEKRASIPGDEYDMYILNMVSPIGILTEEEVKKIEDWLQTEESKEIKQ